MKKFFFLCVLWTTSTTLGVPPTNNSITHNQFNTTVREGAFRAASLCAIPALFFSYLCSDKISKGNIAEGTLCLFAAVLFASAGIYINNRIHRLSH